MLVMDKYGNDVVLPKSAICLKSNKSPEAMDTCPVFNFDDSGAACIPELCSFYRCRDIYIYKYKNK